MRVDPRLGVIERRLRETRRLIAITGGKGGIGKSLIASVLALNLERAGHQVGLLDLDLTSPCDHLILGLKPPVPQEQFGLVPPALQGLHFMSIACFIGDRPAPLRGPDFSNALIELLAIVQWGRLDYLVIDLPPGLGDALLDAVRLLPRAEFLAVATASQVVVETVRRTLRLLVQLDAPILGLLENMQQRETSLVTNLAAEFALPYLGAVPFDKTLEAATGDPACLARTPAAAALQQTLLPLFP